MQDTPALASNLIYFSFVTLTTTGYGDVFPLHPVARSLCNLEAVIGQLLSRDLAGAAGHARNGEPELSLIVRSRRNERNRRSAAGRI